MLESPPVEGLVTRLFQPAVPTVALRSTSATGFTCHLFRGVGKEL